MHEKKQNLAATADLLDDKSLVVQEGHRNLFIADDALRNNGAVGFLRKKSSKVIRYSAEILSDHRGIVVIDVLNPIVLVVAPLSIFSVCSVLHYCIFLTFFVG